MMSGIFGPQTKGTNLTAQQRRARLAARTFVTTGTAAAFIGIAGVPAFAAPGDTSIGSTVANVEVGSTIALTGLTPAFTLSGNPGATVTGLTEVAMNVQTNSLAGYSVTVQAASATLTPTTVSTPANPDSIPIGALSVRETGTTPFTPLSSTAPVTVHGQDTRSAAGGDTIENDFQVVIPFVNEDTYAVTLNYVATTL